MNRHLTIAAAGATLLAVLSGCGSSSPSTSSATTATKAAATGVAGGRYGPTTTAAAAPTTGGPGVTVTVKHDKLGTVLAAGPKKLTVYLFESDRAGASSCSGACESVWPPVTTQGSPVSGTGADAGALGTITRSDGSKQVTYKGHPLYFFIKDKDNGDAYGQGIKSFGSAWYVLSPTGSKIDPS